MKKLTSLFLLLTLALTLFAGCEKKAPAASVQGTPEEIIAKIYSSHKEIELALMGMDVDLADENAVTYYTGLSSADKLSAVSVSETMLGQPYSLVLAKVKNAADAAQVAKDMYAKIDTRKWICVAADTKTAAYCGDVVMFFMIDSEYADVATADSILDAFQKVAGGNAVVIK